MSDQIVQQTKTDIELINDFFFMVFSPNPAKKNVKLWIDGDIKMIMKIEKFLKIIESLIDTTFMKRVECECDSYGGYFLINRPKKELKKLYLNDEGQILDLKSEFNMKEKKKSLSESYFDFIQKNINNLSKKDIKEHISSTSKYNTVKVYNTNTFSKMYRPY